MSSWCIINKSIIGWNIFFLIYLLEISIWSNTECTVQDHIREFMLKSIEILLNLFIRNKHMISILDVQFRIILWNSR